MFHRNIAQAQLVDINATSGVVIFYYLLIYKIDIIYQFY